ncbi:hypothetical protein K0H71_15080 [Bacillus sp. IITD106]|nr:hypothetical protein [Bacillus sp. IITD106]
MLKMNKRECKECGGKIIESSECKVLADGYEVPVYICKDCRKEWSWRTEHLICPEGVE